MKISYKGKNKEYKFRTAEIDSNNQEMLEKVQNVLEEIGWECHGFDECILVSVSDYEDYKDLVDDYKEAKRIARMC